MEQLVLTKDPTIYKHITTKIAGITKLNEMKSGDNYLRWTGFGDVIGLPHQYSPLADVRISKDANGEEIGRNYKKTFIDDLPVLFLKPGVPFFLPSSISSKISGANSSAKAELIQKLVNANSGDEITDSEGSGLFWDSRYYSFKSEFAEYALLVNSMSNMVAIKMGVTKTISSDPMTEEQLDEANATTRRGDYRMMHFMRGSANFHSKTFVPYFMDRASCKYGESGGNSTGESMLAGMMNKVGETSRELTFLLGSTMKAQREQISSAADTLGKRLGSLFSGFNGGLDGLMGKLTGAATVSVQGGNLLFPHIWQDSSFKKSYDFSFTFRSPYGDTTSIYNCVMFPVISLLAFALPRQAGAGGYKAPFIIQGFSKGLFSIDMGMVESITIDKPTNEKAWSKDGFPLEMTVNISIVDLYDTMMQTGVKFWDGLMAENTGMMQYLNAMAGMTLLDYDNYFNMSLKIQEAFWNLNAWVESLGDSIMDNSLVQGIGDMTNMVNVAFDKVKDELANIFAKDDSSEDNSNINWSDIFKPESSTDNNSTTLYSVKVESLNIAQEPDATSKVLQNLVKNDEVQIIETDCGKDKQWVKVKTSTGNEGYTLASYLEKVKEENVDNSAQSQVPDSTSQKQQHNVTVIVPSLNLCQKPDATSKILQKLVRGALVSVVETGCGVDKTWCKLVSSTGNIGYTKTSYLSK